MCGNEGRMWRLSEVIVFRAANACTLVTRGHFRRWRSHHSIRRSQKLHATRKPDGMAVFYRTRVMGDQSLHCGNRHFGRFWLLWPWPWPDDLHIRTSPILPGVTPDVQIWTSYVKAFRSYRLTDRHTSGHPEGWERMRGCIPAPSAEGQNGVHCHTRR